MSNRRTVAAALILGLALVAPPLAPAAQAGGGQERPALRQRINDLYLLRLTRALDLSQEQTAKIYPLVARAEKDKAEVQRRLGQDLRLLRDELGAAAPAEAGLLELVARIRRDRRTIRRIDEDVEVALEGFLTPVQRARYVLFNVEFLRNVGENLGRMRGARGENIRTP